MKCPSCQTELPQNAKFCMACGKTLQSEIACPQCSHANPLTARFCLQCGHALTEPATSPAQPPPSASPSVPASFANGRYVVKKFLGEGGKKKVYLAHDTVLDRDIAFALIKTEKLDEAARTRIKREAQAMGRLGDHPNIVTVFDFGDHEGQPYMVLPLLTGGDVEHLIEKAPDHRLPLDKAIEITRSVLKGLEFAHAKGIIHRDIKPSNVWMSADGTAKVGDFGLAVAVNLSRLTQDGMMVGTVSYMPPEQAMGGKVSAKADLYSLGAMLYEMVTGRPPFVGDDQVAIIGQHINTPPVSPAWHRADLSPALETLIMRLLEKDPEKRPDSATVILQALETIGTAKPAVEPVKEATRNDNPLYRRVFVGREPELKQLQSAFDGAISGQGALMMVLGEPGIGKTSLCEQLATYVTLRGGHTLVGHCYEEGSLSLPYLAFVEAMRSYVLSREVKDLRQELGTGAADVARIVSEIRERLKIKPRPQQDPEEDRYRLLQAVTSFLSNAASVQPLVVVLEDLHDADKGTLEMLTHVSRHLTGARLLIVGTYRDVEVDRNHPLSAALAELRRASTYGRVVLRGLNADEVRRMLETITGESVPWGLAEAVHRQTEGNPLFVQEVVRYLVEEGLLTRKDGRWSPAKDTPLEMSIPEGLRDVIGKRLSRLSPECNQLLSVASVIGREFALDTLKAAAGIDDDVFMNALKEAVRLAALEERSQVGSVRYRFTHAFFRQTLYEEMIAPQRLKLHQQVARILETHYAGRLEEHAAELAEHFSQSTGPADLAKAVSYSEMAAQRAIDVYAHGEAVRLLEQAIKVQQVLDPANKEKQCDLLVALCDALFLASDPKRVLETEAPAAFSLADAIADNRRISRVCLFAVRALINTGQLPAMATPEAAKWIERADNYARPETVERVIADLSFGLQRLAQLRNAEGLLLLKRALDLARRLGDTDSFWLVAYNYLNFITAPQQVEEKLRLAEELAGTPRTGVGLTRVTAALAGSFHVFLEAGQRQRAEEAINEYRNIAQRTKIEGMLRTTVIWDGILAAIDGRLEEVMEFCRRYQEDAKERGTRDYASGFVGLWSRLHLGKANEALESVKYNLSPAPQALCLAYLGRNAEANEILEKVVVKRPGIGTPQDESASYYDAISMAAAVLVENRQVAELLLNRFAGIKGAVTTGRHFTTCIPRHLGAGAAMLGRYEEARQHYQEAIRVTTEMRFRPELALTRLQLAELLLDHYPAEKKEALEHLDFAIKEFREMKMQPSLERALRRKEILKA